MGFENWIDKKMELTTDMWEVGLIGYLTNSLKNLKMADVAV